MTDQEFRDTVISSLARIEANQLNTTRRVDALEVDVLHPETGMRARVDVVETVVAERVPRKRNVALLASAIGALGGLLTALVPIGARMLIG